MSDELLAIKKRRLNVLELQAARYGIDTPPHVTIEIEDLKREIAALKQDLSSSSAVSNQTTIGGNVTGAVLSGTFSGPVNIQNTPAPNSPATNDPAIETILAIFAEPRGLPGTEWEREVRELRALLTSSKRYRLQELPKCTPLELYRALLHIQPAKFHFQGHGTSEGIVLEDNSGETHKVTWRALLNTLTSCETLNCVVLNACNSQVHSQLGQQSFHLITTPDNVSTEATRTFTQGFYEALIAGKSVPSAFAHSRNLLGLQGISEQEWPTLTEAR
jgi:hypothetical protein